ncbi:hypothetical protein [Stutzerimonas stutzeri]|uniref:hypothetical protein n=1 Tax=Stutzerimonas stutzeri TaxID=316 RepID=UPI0015E48EBE|nr:hypothetical protein [Stutzerimonas stutzeri]MBA1280232.1 hypothetical protein [Stutzerimonas stutzeri]
MLLRDFVQGLPYGERRRFRQRMANEHGVSVSLVRKWENDPPPGDWPTEKKRAQVRRHPAALTSIEITERLTGCLVMRYDLRPECWETPGAELKIGVSNG